MVGSAWELAARLLPADPDFYTLAVRLKGNPYVCLFFVQPTVIPEFVETWGPINATFPAGLLVEPD